MSFDTGDNEPKAKKLLKTSFNLLRKKIPSIIVLSDVKDRHGTYGKIIKVINRKYILVARSTIPFKGCVSTQKRIVDYASQSNCKILLAYGVKDFPYFYAFNPAEIIEKHQGINVRKEDEYYNYPIKLGVRVFKGVY